MKKKDVMINGLLHHYFRFGVIGNVNVLICRIFGHRVNNNPAHSSCERCGLAYQEIYYKKGEGYFIESGIIDKSLFDKDGNYKYSTEINGKEYPLEKPVFELLRDTSIERDDLKGTHKQY